MRKNILAQFLTLVHLITFRINHRNREVDQCQQLVLLEQFLLIRILIHQNIELLALKRAHQTSLHGQSEQQISHFFRVIEHQVQIDSNHLIRLETLLQYTENQQVIK